MENHFIIDKSANETAIVIRFVDGYIDSSNHRLLRDELKQYLCDLDCKSRLKLIVFSFKNVKSIDSEGLGMLVSVWKFVSYEMSANISFSNCSEHLLHFFRLCKLEHIFNIYSTEIDAMENEGVKNFM